MVQFRVIGIQHMVFLRLQTHFFSKVREVGPLKWGANKKDPIFFKYITGGHRKNL